MSYGSSKQRLSDLRKQIAEIRREMREVQKEVEPQPVDDYTFANGNGSVSLSDLFGSKNDLFVVHSMGGKCPYCTLWADGYNGTYPQLSNRAAFVVSSPDSPAEQARLAETRGWRFPMISHKGTSFSRDMGYGDEEGGYFPGVSVFQRRNGGAIVRVSDTGFAPRDDFCPVYHFLDMLPEGREGWEPVFR